MSYKPTGSITFNQHWMKLTAQKKEKKENRTRKVLFKVVFPCKKDNQTDMSCIHFFTKTFKTNFNMLKFSLKQYTSAGSSRE